MRARLIANQAAICQTPHHNVDPQNIVCCDANILQQDSIGPLQSHA
jgi:hypothetical protein